MNQYFEHLKVISKHKYYVMRACFKTGFYKRGLLHDNSKFGIEEFVSSARYFQGHRSPIDAEKEDIGYSKAWQSHKGRNKHHWQYWVDWERGQLYAIEMPIEYVVEMVCDWVGAGKAYNKEKWTINEVRNWYEKEKDVMILHEKTRKFIEFSLFTIIRTEQDFYYWFHKNVVGLHYRWYVLENKGSIAGF